MQRNQSSKRMRGCLGCGGCLLVVVVLVVVVPTIVILTWSNRSSRRAEAELAQLRAAGEPTSPEELRSYYPVTPQQREAAQIWLAALRPFEGEPFNTHAANAPVVGMSFKEIPPPGQPWPELEVSEKLLQQYEGFLGRLHEAAASGRPTRYPTDFSQGWNMPLEYIQTVRVGARVLVLEAHVRSHRGDAHGAAQSIHAIFMLADSLKQEPILISQLVRYAIAGMGRDVLQRQLREVDFPDEDLDRLQAHLRAVDYAEGLHRAMIGERVTGIMAIDDPAMMGAPGGPPAAGWGLFRNANLSVYLQYMGRVIAATGRPWPPARQDMEQIASDVEAGTSGGSIFSRPAHIMAAELIPANGAMLNATARFTAANRATDAVIAVERFRRAQGRLPESLEELVPKFLPRVPADPFDGRPLRYIVQEDDYVVYSIGRDGVDNGGQGFEHGEPDLVFPVQLRQPEE